MSIIHDALKKVEKSVDRDKTLPSTRGKPGRNMKISRYLILFPVALIAAGIFFLKIQTPIKPATLPLKLTPAPLSPLSSVPLKTSASPTEEKRITPPALENPPAEKPDISYFILNGVFFSEGQGYALINNQILKENDVIKGAKVVKIGLDEVELNLGGQIITLSTKNK